MLVSNSIQKKHNTGIMRMKEVKGLKIGHLGRSHLTQKDEVRLHVGIIAKTMPMTTAEYKGVMHLGMEVL